MNPMKGQRDRFMVLSQLIPAEQRHFLRIEIASQCPLNHHRGYEVGRYQKRLTDIVCPRVGCIEAQPLRVGGLEVWILASPRAVSVPAKDRTWIKDGFGVGL